MKIKWLGVLVVLAIVVVIIAAKMRFTHVANSTSDTPQVLLVATPAEAASRTRCGQIVRLVRTAGEHGVKVAELTPDSSSSLIGRYHVLKTPTVLIFGPNGAVQSRFEGEKPETLAALQSEMQRITQ